VTLVGRFRGAGRVVAQIVAWSTLPVYLAAIGAAQWFGQRAGVALLTSFEDALLFIGFGAFAVVGSLLVARRPDNVVSWIMAGIGLMIGVFPAAETYAAYVMRTRGQPDALAVLGVWANSWYWYLMLALTLIYLPLLFPDGRLPSRRWWFVAAVAAAGTVTTVGFGALSDPLLGQSFAYQIDNPIGVAWIGRAEEHPLFILGGLCLVVGLLGATAAVVVRFRRSRGVERQQLKWFLFAVALLPAFALSAVIPVLGDALGLILVALPTAVAIAVLRYRLYEIDLIIRRTLIYSVLSAVLALAYLGSVLVLENLFRALTGQGQNSLVVVLSTLAIAALFGPVRGRVQRVIDRRFYRRKYDAARTLAGFASAARDETDLDRLSAQLVSVVDETMQPESIGLWLRGNKP
jgi:hypothetical protein